MDIDLSRRDFVKSSVAAATAAVVGVPMIDAAPGARLDRHVTADHVRSRHPQLSRAA